MQISSPRHVCPMAAWLSFSRRPARGFQAEWIYSHLLLLPRHRRHSSQILSRPHHLLLRINKLCFNRRQTRSAVSGGLGSKVQKYAMPLRLFECSFLSFYFTQIFFVHTHADESIELCSERIKRWYLCTMISLLNFPDSNLDGPHPPPLPTKVRICLLDGLDIGELNSRNDLHSTVQVDHNKEISGYCFIRF